MVRIVFPFARTLRVSKLAQVSVARKFCVGLCQRSRKQLVEGMWLVFYSGNDCLRGLGLQRCALSDSCPLSGARMCQLAQV